MSKLKFFVGLFAMLMAKGTVVVGSEHQFEQLLSFGQGQVSFDTERFHVSAKFCCLDKPYQNFPDELEVLAQNPKLIKILKKIFAETGPVSREFHFDPNIEKPYVHYAFSVTTIPSTLEQMRAVLTPVFDHIAISEEEKDLFASSLSTLEDFPLLKGFMQKHFTPDELLSRGDQMHELLDIGLCLADPNILISKKTPENMKNYLDQLVSLHTALVFSELLYDIPYVERKDPFSSREAMLEFNNGFYTDIHGLKKRQELVHGLMRENITASQLFFPPLARDNIKWLKESITVEERIAHIRELTR